MGLGPPPCPRLGVEVLAQGAGTVRAAALRRAPQSRVSRGRGDGARHDKRRQLVHAELAPARVVVADLAGGLRARGQGP